MPSFVDLPVELVEEIASYLDLGSLCALRLIRKEFMDESFRYVADRHLNVYNLCGYHHEDVVKQPFYHYAANFLATAEWIEEGMGFEHVARIAEHEKLSLEVKTLVLGSWELGPRWIYERLSSLSDEERVIYDKIVNSWEYSAVEGFSTAILASTIAKFPNLDALYLGDDLCRLHGFKWTKSSLCVEDPYKPNNYQAWDPVNQFIPAITAIAASGMNITTLHCSENARFDWTCMAAMPEPKIQHLRPALNNLRSVKFWVCDNLDGGPSPSDDWLWRLLSAMPSLVELGLAGYTDCTRDSTAEITSDFMAQLALVSLPQLEHVELFQLWGSADQFQKFLNNHKQSLKSLDVKYLNLRRHRCLQWRTVLESLKRFPVLNRLFIDRVSEDGKSVDFHPYEGPWFQLAAELRPDYDALANAYDNDENWFKLLNRSHELVGEAIRPGLTSMIEYFHNNWFNSWNDPFEPGFECYTWTEKSSDLVDKPSDSS